MPPHLDPHAERPLLAITLVPQAKYPYYIFELPCGESLLSLQLALLHRLSRVESIFLVTSDADAAKAIDTFVAQQSKRFPKASPFHLKNVQEKHELSLIKRAWLSFTDPRCRNYDFIVTQANVYLEEGTLSKILNLHDSQVESSSYLLSRLICPAFRNDLAHYLLSSSGRILKAFSAFKKTFSIDPQELDFVVCQNRTIALDILEKKAFREIEDSVGLSYFDLLESLAANETFKDYQIYGQVVDFPCSLQLEPFDLLRLLKESSQVDPSTQHWFRDRVLCPRKKHQEKQLLLGLREPPVIRDTAGGSVPLANASCIKSCLIGRQFELLNYDLEGDFTLEGCLIGNNVTLDGSTSLKDCIIFSPGNEDAGSLASSQDIQILPVKDCSSADPHIPRPKCEKWELDAPKSALSFESESVQSRRSTDIQEDDFEDEVYRSCMDLLMEEELDLSELKFLRLSHMKPHSALFGPALSAFFAAYRVKTVHLDDLLVFLELLVEDSSEDLANTLLDALEAKRYDVSVECWRGLLARLSPEAVSDMHLRTGLETRLSHWIHEAHD